MRKMVIHFGPDIEGGGIDKHELRDADPAEKRYTEEPEPEIEARISWLSLLPLALADRIRKLERAIDNAAIGIKILKKIKAIPRRRKILIGALSVAGVAGAAYLVARKRK